MIMTVPKDLAKGVVESGETKIDAIITHIEKSKATQPASNAGHHVRWDTAKRMVNNGDYGAAISYAEQWCGRRWKPWCELITKLKEIVKR